MTATADFDQALEAFNSGELDRARAIAEREQRAAPGPHWQHLLGLICCRLGRPEDGLEHLRAALSAEPRNLQYRAMLVRALIDARRADEALQLARRPAPGPLAADLWRLRSEAAEAAGSIADRAEAVHNLRLAALTERLAQDPGNVSLLFERGRLLGWLASDDEAEADFRMLLDLNPANAEVVRELGNILERGNRLEELRQLVDGAIAASCDRSHFALLEALLAWRAGNAEEALQWLSRVGPREGRLRALQLEVKVQDALGNSGEAFRAAKASNDAVPNLAQWREAARRMRARFRREAEVIGPDWAAGWQPMESRSPLRLAFLVGFPRSGTTLLDTFLMGHPDIQVLEEVPLIGVVAERIGPIETLPTLDESMAEQLRRFYFNALAAQVPEGFRGLVIDKMPLNMLWAPILHRLFPDAKILFSQRHPCDCVLSGFFQSFNLNPAMANFLDLSDAADFYDVTMEIWWRSEHSLPLVSHCTVYEKLVENPEEELRAAVEFLGLDWQAALLNHRQTALRRGTISTPSYEQVTEPLNSRAVGRWRRYGEQLRPVLPMLLPWAKRLEYES